MVIEGVVEGQSLGDIAVDDIKILEINMADCKGESAVKLIKISKQPACWFVSQIDLNAYKMLHLS